MYPGDEVEQQRTEGNQNPVIHEGAPPDDLDTNERADEAVTVVGPSGEPAPRARPG